jgi:hypothetical protein
MDQIVVNYKKSQSELVETSERVIKEMDNNSDYPTPPAAYAELKKVLPELRLAIADAKGRDKKMVSIKMIRRPSCWLCYRNWQTM